MNIKEYIISQLGRTKNKKYEAYVVTRIIHLLNDFSIKFVTQQYVTRGESRVLTDLYFPQFGLHIEVDEGHHFNQANIEKDKIREADIINATDHKILRIDVTKSFHDINTQIDEVVNKIKNMRQESSFIPWDIDSEFDSATYIKRGYIAIEDNVAFKTIKDACNCFGHNYTGYQRAGATHPDKNIMLWFPKLFPNGDWDNQISPDEKVITERNKDDEKAKEHVSSHINNKDKHKHQRIVFAKVRGNLGEVLYRFRGQYQLDVEASNDALVWRRIATKVKTYEQNCDGRKTSSPKI